MSEARELSLRRKRVVTLLNAIADIHYGDLLAILELDKVTPMLEIGENDTFKLGEDGKVIWTPGFPPPEKSLKDRVRTGDALARILELLTRSRSSFFLRALTEGLRVEAQPHAS